MRTGAKKRTCADVFSRARLFSHSNMHCRDYAWKDKILNDHLSNNNKKIQPHRGVHLVEVDRNWVNQEPTRNQEVFFLLKNQEPTNNRNLLVLQGSSWFYQEVIG